MKLLAILSANSDQTFWIRRVTKKQWDSTAAISVLQVWFSYSKIHKSVNAKVLHDILI
jgi:hypothetical protein